MHSYSVIHVHLFSWLGRYHSLVCNLFSLNGLTDELWKCVYELYFCRLQRLVVCLEEMLYIHNIRDMKILHTIRDTPPNPRGLLALSVNADNSYLAYPGSGSTGQVQVFDAFNLQAKTVIHAHASPLAAMAFNATGTFLATASEKGTVIRVFSTADASRLFEFRRGMKRYASIYSIAFSPDDIFLAVSSNTVTVHVFRLQNFP